MTSAANQHHGYDHNHSRPSVTDDPVANATAEQIGELRGEELTYLTRLHQASARPGNIHSSPASYPRSRLARAALDVAAEHIRVAEQVLREHDEVAVDHTDPTQSPAGHHLSARHLQQRVEREQQALRLVLGQAG